MNDKNNLMGFYEGNSKESGRTIPAGFYATIPDILKAITIKEDQNKIFFNFNPAMKRVRITVKSKSEVTLYDGLAQLFRFRTIPIDAVEAAVSKESEYIPNPCAQHMVQMVYTDIIESQVVGNILAPLLRIVNVIENDREMETAEYDRPHYLPVSPKIIHTMEIVIKNHTGHFAFERVRT